MALFSKLFKRSHDPYEIPGRWYHFSIDRVNQVFLCDIPIHDITYSTNNVAFRLENEDIIITDSYLTRRDFVDGYSGTSTVVLGTASIGHNVNGFYVFALQSANIKYEEGYFFGMRKSMP